MINVKSIAAGLYFIAAATVLSTPPVQATPFSFEYDDSILFTNIAGIAGGDTAQITIVLDNGGANNLSQTWTATNLLSVKFDFNNGGLVTTFSSPWGAAGLNGGFGAFSTDAGGNIIQVFDSLFDFTSDPNGDFTTNGNATSFTWFLSGTNGVYLQNDGAKGVVDLVSVAALRTTAAWTQTSTTTSVPEPATLAIFGLGLAGLGLMRRRRRTA